MQPRNPARQFHDKRKTYTLLIRVLAAGAWAYLRDVFGLFVRKEAYKE